MFLNGGKREASVSEVLSFTAAGVTGIDWVLSLNECFPWEGPAKGVGLNSALGCSGFNV